MKRHPLVHCPVSSGPTFGAQVTREKLARGWVPNLRDTALAGTYSRPAYNRGRLRMRPVAAGSHDEHEGALA